MKLKCSTCGEMLDESNFCKCKKNRMRKGLSYVCRQCQSQRLRKQRLRKSEKKLVFKVYLRDLCSKFEGSKKAQCHINIHRLAKAFNDEGKLKIRFIEHNLYVFRDKEAFDEFMERTTLAREGGLI